MEDASIRQLNGAHIGVNVERRNSIQQVGYTTSLSSWLEQGEGANPPCCLFCDASPRGRLAEPEPGREAEETIRRVLVHARSPEIAWSLPAFGACTIHRQATGVFELDF
jgi:hypothetical protein